MLATLLIAMMLRLAAESFERDKDEDTSIGQLIVHTTAAAIGRTRR